MHKSLLKIDFNLLKTLVILIDEKSAKRTAERLNVSQPAVSRSLAKLREQLDDPLFIRAQYGLELTPKAEKLALLLPDLLQQIGDSLIPESAFDIAEYEGNISIASNGYLIEKFGCDFIERLKEKAPKATLHLFNWGSQSIARLSRSELHMGLHYFPIDMPKTIIQRKIVNDKFAVVCRKGHPLTKKKMELADFAKYPIANLISPQYNESRINLVEKLVSHNVFPDIKYRSQHLTPMLHMIKNSDVITQLSTYFFEPDHFDLAKVELPDEFDELSTPVAIYYPSKFRNVPLYQWLEKEMTSVCKALIRR